MEKKPAIFIKWDNILISTPNANCIIGKNISNDRNKSKVLFLRIFGDTTNKNGIEKAPKSITSLSSRKKNSKEDNMIIPDKKTYVSLSLFLCVMLFAEFSYNFLNRTSLSIFKIRFIKRTNLPLSLILKGRVIILLTLLSYW